MNIERLGDTEPLLERDSTDIELDMLDAMCQSPGDDTYTIRVNQIALANGVAIQGAKEPEILIGNESLLDGLSERLRTEFGSGTYRIRISKNKRLVKRYDMSVLAPNKSVSLPPQSELAAVLTAFGKQNEQIIALLSRPNVPAVVATQSDPLAMLDKVLGVIQKLQPTKQEQAEPVLASEKALEYIMKGVDLADKLGGQGREKGMMDLIGDALNSPIIEKLLTNVIPTHPGVRLPPPQPRREASAGTQPVKESVPDPNATPTAEQITAEQIKRTQGIILWLLDKANHGSSFETYAEWAFDNLPPPLINGLLAESDPIASMTGLVPAIASQKQWFISLIDDLRELVNTAKAAEATEINVPGRSPSPINSNTNSRWNSGGGNDFGQDEGISEDGEN